ncbi:MAG TPA: hypothetical protein VGJ83_05565 [Gemmatimonadales bacterium]
MRLSVAWTLALLALLFGMARPAPAQARRWERQAREQLAHAVQGLREKGFERPRLTRVSALDNEESEASAVTLNAGRGYAVVGVCDADCSGLHLVVSTAAGSDIAADRSGGGVPLVRITPRETGSYRVKAVMAACRMSPCWYGVAVVEER